jgi:predicted methyltransferase
MRTGPFTNALATILVLGLWPWVCAPALASTVPADVTSAVADPARAKDAQADARRHPAELVAFARVKPGDTVVDLIPGAGYWTRIFSQVVGPTGHVYAILPNEYAKADADNVPLLQALVKDPHYANVTLLMEPAAQFEVPVKADVVWTCDNYHDYPDKFMGKVDPRILDRAVYGALKPGGLFVVVDHVAAPGSGLRDTDTLHRIDPQVVKTQVAGAGFRLVGTSAVLHNPADDHKRLVFDPAIRGHTDQFAFRFRKPG